MGRQAGAYRHRSVQLRTLTMAALPSGPTISLFRAKVMLMSRLGDVVLCPVAVAES
jgi:hypothetical protein